jgi:F-type H+-transporting ATPase subunit delta
MNPAVEGYTTAIFETADDRNTLASELAAIERLVGGNAELNAALTDTSVPGPARRAVLSELLDGRVAESARRLASFTVGAVSAPDVPVALNWIGHRARSNADGHVLELALLGHQAARARVGGYAAAVFEDADTAQLEEIEDQLFRFARIVESTPALRSALTDRDLQVEARQGLVDQLLSDRADAAAQRLVRFVVAGGRPRDFVGALDWLVVQTASARGWRVARVRSAEPIEDAQRRQLAESLSNFTGSSVELQVTLDQDLLGGAVVQIGDLQIDASARGRLNHLREELLPAGHGAAGAYQTRGDT